MKYLFIPLLTLTFLLATPGDALADNKQAGSSASLAVLTNSEAEDKRIVVLHDYLEAQNSPLADSAKTFVKAADANGLDWRFVASISGIESTFAQHLPPDSYNAWGWGIYGDNMINFTSYDQAIDTISKSLRTNYMDKWGATDVYQIGKIYAASPTWAARVAHVMVSMETFSQSNPDYRLSLSI